MRRTLFCLTALLLQGAPLAAEDAALPEAKAAESVALAEVVPHTCPAFETDRQAVAALLLRAGLTGTDVTTRYVDEVLEAQDQFTASAQRNAATACSQAWDRLGDKGLGLLAPHGD